MSLRAALALATFLMLSAIDANAVVIRGTIRVPAAREGDRVPLNPYPGRANALPNPTPIVHGAVTDAVIYLDGPVPPRGGEAAAAEKPARLAQKGQAFTPRVLPVMVGARVDFPNYDPIYHNVFSVSPTKRFDLGKYARGKSKSLVFTKPGRVNVYCEIHSGMEAFILVLPHPWFTQPDASGSFALPDLPAGTYKLKAWHPDFGERAVTVIVSDREAKGVEVDF
jgi:plastocyanin